MVAVRFRIGMSLLSLGAAEKAALSLVYLVYYFENIDDAVDFPSSDSPRGVIPRWRM